jgi:hypothetical protein
VEVTQDTLSRRDRLFNHIVEHGIDFDTFYSYDQLETIAEVDRTAIYGLMKRVSGKLGKLYHRRLAVEPTKGYRVIRPEEHESESKKKVRNATNRVNDAVKIQRDADVGAMTPAQRDRHDLVLSGLLATQRAVVHLAKKVERVEAVQASHTESLESQDDRIERLEATVRRLMAQAGTKN